MRESLGKDLRESCFDSCAIHANLVRIFGESRESFALHKGNKCVLAR